MIWRLPQDCDALIDLTRKRLKFFKLRRGAIRFGLPLIEQAAYPTHQHSGTTPSTGVP